MTLSTRATRAPDLLGVFVGSEGTLWDRGARITCASPAHARLGAHAARGLRDDRRCIGDAVSRGHRQADDPARLAIEMMDAATVEARPRRRLQYPAIRPGMQGRGADRRARRAGAPRCSRTRPPSSRSAARFKAPSSSTPPRRPRGARADLWLGRKSSFAAMGRISSELLRAGRRRPAHEACAGGAPPSRPSSRAEYGLRVASVFHAGDGNLHPLVLYDEWSRGSRSERSICSRPRSSTCLHRAPAARSTGERRRRSVDKACSMPKLFGARDLETMLRLRTAFDPAGLANPGKIFPTPRLCGEVPGPVQCTSAGAEAGLAERLLSR